MKRSKPHPKDFYATSKWSEVDDLLMSLDDDLDAVLKQLEADTPPLAEILQQLEHSCDRDQQKPCWFEVLR